MSNPSPTATGAAINQIASAGIQEMPLTPRMTAASVHTAAASTSWVLALALGLRLSAIDIYVAMAFSRSMTRCIAATATSIICSSGSRVVIF